MALVKYSPKAKADSGLEFPLLNPVTDQPLFEKEDGTSYRVFFTVHGADSKECKKIQRRQTNRRLELAAKSRNKKPNVTAEMIEAENMALLVGCTISWRTEILDGEGKVKEQKPGQIELEEGQWLDCTPENVQAAFEALPWAKEQADDQIGDRKDFLQN